MSISKRSIFLLGEGDERDNAAVYHGPRVDDEHDYMHDRFENNRGRRRRVRDDRRNQQIIEEDSEEEEGGNRGRRVRQAPGVAIRGRNIARGAAADGRRRNRGHGRARMP